MSGLRLKTQARRKRGARPGNTHDLKHGLYSKHISVRDDIEMGTMGPDGSLPELAVARTRLEACLDRQEEAASLVEWLAVDAAMQGWVEKISMITHRNAVLGKDTRMAFVTIMDYIRAANHRQKVVQ